jgi:hypothetical protein
MLRGRFSLTSTAKRDAAGPAWDRVSPNLDRRFDLLAGRRQEPAQNCFLVKPQHGPATFIV